MKKIKYTDTEYTMEQIIAPTYITKYAIEHPEILYLLEDKVNLYNSRTDKTLRYRLDSLVQNIKEVPNHVVKNIIMVYISHLGVLNDMSIDWAMWLYPVGYKKESCYLYGYGVNGTVELCTIDGLGTLYGFQEYPAVFNEIEYVYADLSVIEGGKKKYDEYDESLSQKILSQYPLFLNHPNNGKLM